jgi:hypothetical protein
VFDSLIDIAGGFTALIIISRKGAKGAKPN